MTPQSLVYLCKSEAIGSGRCLTARAGRATHRARSGLGHSATIANARRTHAKLG